MAAKQALGVGEDIFKALINKPSPQSKGFSGYHGTGSTFMPSVKNPLGEFSEEVLQSGEGTQAFGWGHYLTDEPRIGRAYRDEADVDNVNFEVFEDLLKKHQDLVDNPKATPEDYQKAAILEQIMIDGDLQGVLSRGKEAYGDAGWEYLKKEIEPNFSREGSLYEVNVNASKDELLKWEDALTDQPESVTSKLAEMAKDGVQGIDPNSPYLKDVKGWELYSDLRDQFENETYIALRDGVLSDETPLLKIIDYPIEDMKMREPMELYQELASRYLDKKGVKGIVFPAGESGALGLDTAGQASGGVNNYVIFDKNAMDIAKKYGVPLATTMGGIAFSATPQQAEAGIWSPLQRAGNIIIRPGDVGYDSRFLVKGSKNKKTGETPMRGGEIERGNALSVGIESRGNQGTNTFNWEDAIGRGYVTGESDRTAAGGLVTSVNGVQLNFPVDLKGGQGFPLDTGYGWASDKGAVTNLVKRFEKAAEGTGMNPLYLPWRMAPSGGDFAPFNGNLMMSYANAAMGKDTKKAIDKAIKAIDPKFPGIDSPMQQVWFNSSDKATRDKVVNLLDVKFRDEGGLSISEARLGVTDAQQLNAPDAGLQSVIEIDLGKGVAGRQHPIYDRALYGTKLGAADRGSAWDVASDYVNNAGERLGDKWVNTGEELAELSGDVRGNANYALLRTKPYGVITESIAERLANAPQLKPTAGLLSLLGTGAASADTAIPTPSQQASGVIGMPSQTQQIAQDVISQQQKYGGTGSIKGVAQNPISRGAESFAGMLHQGARNLENAGILSLLSEPLSSLGDIASRAAYGESKVTDPAEALLSASAFVPSMYFTRPIANEDIQSLMWKQLLGN